MLLDDVVDHHVPLRTRCPPADMNDSDRDRCVLARASARSEISSHLRRRDLRSPDEPGRDLSQKADDDAENGDHQPGLSRQAEVVVVHASERQFTVAGDRVENAVRAGDDDSRRGGRGSRRSRGTHDRRGDGERAGGEATHEVPLQVADLDDVRAGVDRVLDDVAVTGRDQLAVLGVEYPVAGEVLADDRGSVHRESRTDFQEHTALDTVADRSRGRRGHRHRGVADRLDGDTAREHAAAAEANRNDDLVTQNQFAFSLLVLVALALDVLESDAGAAGGEDHVDVFPVGFAVERFRVDITGSTLEFLRHGGALELLRLEAVTVEAGVDHVRVERDQGDDFGGRGVQAIRGRFLRAGSGGTHEEQHRTGDQGHDGNGERPHHLGQEHIELGHESPFRFISGRGFACHTAHFS